MTRYIARFMKNVLGENGHEAEICQRAIEIDALCVTDAAELCSRTIHHQGRLRTIVRPRNRSARVIEFISMT